MAELQQTPREQQLELPKAPISVFDNEGKWIIPSSQAEFAAARDKLLHICAGHEPGLLKVVGQSPGLLFCNNAQCEAVLKFLDQKATLGSETEALVAIEQLGEAYKTLCPKPEALIFSGRLEELWSRLPQRKFVIDSVRVEVAAEQVKLALGSGNNQLLEDALSQLSALRPDSSLCETLLGHLKGYAEKGGTMEDFGGTIRKDLMLIHDEERLSRVCAVKDTSRLLNLGSSLSLLVSEGSRTKALAFLNEVALSGGNEAKAAVKEMGEACKTLWGTSYGEEFYRNLALIPESCSQLRETVLEVQFEVIGQEIVSAAEEGSWKKLRMAADKLEAFPGTREDMRLSRVLYAIRDLDRLNYRFPTRSDFTTRNENIKFRHYEPTLSNAQMEALGVQDKCNKLVKSMWSNLDIPRRELLAICDQKDTSQLNKVGSSPGLHNKEACKQAMCWLEELISTDGAYADIAVIEMAKAHETLRQVDNNYLGDFYQSGPLLGRMAALRDRITNPRLLSVFNQVLSNILLKEVDPALRNYLDYRLLYITRQMASIAKSEPNPESASGYLEITGALRELSMAISDSPESVAEKVDAELADRQPDASQEKTSNESSLPSQTSYFDLYKRYDIKGAFSTQSGWKKCKTDDDFEAAKHRLLDMLRDGDIGANNLSIIRECPALTRGEFGEQLKISKYLLEVARYMPEKNSEAMNLLGHLLHRRPDFGLHDWALQQFIESGEASPAAVKAVTEVFVMSGQQKLAAAVDDFEYGDQFSYTLNRLRHTLRYLELAIKAPGGNPAFKGETFKKAYEGLIQMERRMDSYSLEMRFRERRSTNEAYARNKFLPGLKGCSARLSAEVSRILKADTEVAEFVAKVQAQEERRITGHKARLVEAENRHREKASGRVAPGASTAEGTNAGSVAPAGKSSAGSADGAPMSASEKPAAASAEILPRGNHGSARGILTGGVQVDVLNLASLALELFPGSGNTPLMLAQPPQSAAVERVEPGDSPLTVKIRAPKADSAVIEKGNGAMLQADPTGGVMPYPKLPTFAERVRALGNTELPSAKTGFGKTSVAAGMFTVLRLLTTNQLDQTAWEILGYKVAFNPKNVAREAGLPEFMLSSVDNGAKIGLTFGSTLASLYVFHAGDALATKGIAAPAIKFAYPKYAYRSALKAAAAKGLSAAVAEQEGMLAAQAARKAVTNYFAQHGILGAAGLGFAAHSAWNMWEGVDLGHASDWEAYRRAGVVAEGAVLSGPLIGGLAGARLGKRAGFWGAAAGAFVGFSVGAWRTYGKYKEVCEDLERDNRFKGKLESLSRFELGLVKAPDEKDNPIDPETARFLKRQGNARFADRAADIVPELAQVGEEQIEAVRSAVKEIEHLWLSQTGMKDPGGLWEGVKRYTGFTALDSTVEKYTGYRTVDLLKMDNLRDRIADNLGNVYLSDKQIIGLIECDRGAEGDETMLASRYQRAPLIEYSGTGDKLVVVRDDLQKYNMELLGLREGWKNLKEVQDSIVRLRESPEYRRLNREEYKRSKRPEEHARELYSFLFENEELQQYRTAYIEQQLPDLEKALIEKRFPNLPEVLKLAARDAKGNIVFPGREELALQLPAVYNSPFVQQQVARADQELLAMEALRKATLEQMPADMQQKIQDGMATPEELEEHVPLAWERMMTHNPEAQQKRAAG